MPLHCTHYKTCPLWNTMAFKNNRSLNQKKKKKHVKISKCKTNNRYWNTLAAVSERKREDVKLLADDSRSSGDVRSWIKIADVIKPVILWKRNNLKLLIFKWLKSHQCEIILSYKHKYILVSFKFELRNYRLWVFGVKVLMCLIAESHSQVIKLRRFGLVASPASQPAVSVFDYLWIGPSILQISQLRLNSAAGSIEIYVGLASSNYIHVRPQAVPLSSSGSSWSTVQAAHISLSGI